MARLRHSGQQLPYERRDPRRVVAFTSSLCSDSPGSVRACRQAFAGDPARTPNTHLSVSLRVFASLREANEAQTPSPQRQSAGRQSQRTDLGLESPSYLHSCPIVSNRVHSCPIVSIRVHSCPFVVQRHPCVSFASSRLRVFASSRETNSPRHSTATLVISNLRILAASNVLFPSEDKQKNDQ